MPLRLFRRNSIDIHDRERPAVPRLHRKRIKMRHGNHRIFPFDVDDDIVPAPVLIVVIKKFSLVLRENLFIERSGFLLFFYII